MPNFEETKHGRKYSSPMKAIRAQCEECIGGKTVAMILTCVSKNCPLYAYRTGKNPFSNKRKFTDEQKKVLSERAKEMVRNKIKKGK